MYKKILLSVFLCFLLISLCAPSQAISAYSLNSIPFVILSSYKVTADIGEEFYILAVTSNGKKPTWKSSNSKVVSVNTYGKIITKKTGAATITAKINNAEASCKITVNKTKITINAKSASIERDETIKLSVITSNNSEVTWKSQKRSIAIVDERGKVTGLKPGQTLITATADGSSTTCKVTVKSPTIKLSQTTIKLYRGQSAKLSAIVSSKVNPKWKTNKKSIAIVDEHGVITAQKHGTAIISATVDGIIKTCEVIVLKPDITLNQTNLCLKKGSSVTITATVSSHNLPVWSSSNPNIVTVNSYGKISALQKGKAYIYASEDGTKVRCVIQVTE